MKLHIYCTEIIISGLWIMQLHAAPLIQKIVNDSDVGFVILKHSDQSSCSLSNRGIVIDAHKTFEHEFLLEIGKPSVVLRPIYYLDPTTNTKIMFVDQQYNIVPAKLTQAYALWKSDKKKTMKKIKNFPTPQVWLSDWIGLDISVFPHEVEIFGYLMNLSRVMIKNNKQVQARWLSYAKGIFSGLVTELEISQHRRKGIRANMKVLPGEGGVCTDSVVERL